MFFAHFIKQVAILSVFSLFFTVFYSNANIVTSIKPIGFIASAIANGVTDTEVLLPNGASPHSYSLKPSDLLKLKSANLVIWIGDDMETFLPPILRQIDESKQIELADDPSIRALLKKGDHSGHEHSDKDEHHHHGEFNMHIWLSLEIAKSIAEVIHTKLLGTYPDKAGLITENYETFVKELINTQGMIAKKLAPVQNRGYFVFHDGYGYFESEFNLNHLGSFTINPAIQPGVKKIHEIQSKLNEKKAVCVFREPQFSPTIVNKLIEGTNIKNGELDPLGMNIQLSKDSYFSYLLNVTQQFLKCLQ